MSRTELLYVFLLSDCDRAAGSGPEMRGFGVRQDPPSHLVEAGRFDRFAHVAPSIGVSRSMPRSAAACQREQQAKATAEFPDDLADLAASAPSETMGPFCEDCLKFSV